MVTQKKQVVSPGGRAASREWQVDVSALRLVKGNDWLTDFPDLINTDLEQMAKTFPHWLLAVDDSQSEALACPDDGDYFVPKDGALRCVNCGTILRKPANRLIWSGMLPVQITGAEHVERKIRSLIQADRMPLPYVDKGALFLLVPITIEYSTAWPNIQPDAYYCDEFFQCLGESPPGVSHARHMNGDLRMCLFASWDRMTIREVIQNRIAPHALAQVKIANGERPDSRWFNV